MVERIRPESSLAAGGIDGDDMYSQRQLLEGPDPRMEGSNMTSSLSARPKLGRLAPARLRVHEPPH